MGECFVEGLGGIKEWECLHRATGSINKTLAEGSLTTLDTPTDATLISDYDELMFEVSVSGTNSTYAVRIGWANTAFFISFNGSITSTEAKATSRAIFKSSGMYVNTANAIFRSYAGNLNCGNTPGFSSTSPSYVFTAFTNSSLNSLPLKIFSDTATTVNLNWTYTIYGKKYDLP